MSDRALEYKPILGPDWYKDYKDKPASLYFRENAVRISAHRPQKRSGGILYEEELARYLLRKRRIDFRPYRPKAETHKIDVVDGATDSSNKRNRSAVDDLAARAALIPELLRELVFNPLTIPRW